MNQLCDSDNLHRIDYFIQRETVAKNKGNIRSKIWVSKWNWETNLNSWKCDNHAGLNYREEADTWSDDTRNRRINKGDKKRVRRSSWTKEEINWTGGRSC